MKNNQKHTKTPQKRIKYITKKIRSKKMKCDICEEEVSKTIPFYWGFFKTNYEKEKWINACENCTRKFQQASHLYKIDRTKLLELEQTIKHNINQKNKTKTRKKDT